MSHDPELRAHQEWLGYLQPVGLVVSPAALRDAQAFVNKNIIREQSLLIGLVSPPSQDPRNPDPPDPKLSDFPAFTREFLGWEASDLAGGPNGPPLPPSLEVPLPEYGETLAPTYAVPDPDTPGSYVMLIEVRPDSSPLDDTLSEDPSERRWNASPQSRFERLLRANQTPIGLLANPDAIRIVYAPRGESTGHLTFPIKPMCEVAGRPIVAALHLLLGADRLFTLATNQRLPWILHQSRKYQNEVSTQLSGQVLRALNELMRGFQSANDATSGALLRDVLKDSPQDVYGGLLTSLLRMVFILYAEDRGLLSSDPVYTNSYSLAGLYERLREDDAQYPDTMEQRFGAWTRFLALCRVIYDGGGHGAFHLPPRHGQLFDPDAFPFLEGRPPGSQRDSGQKSIPPRVADGVMFRVLQNLLMLDGERLSYRSLDVEQIGSVYEAMMGFEVQVAKGPSIGLRPAHVVVDLAALAAASAAGRVEALKKQASCTLTGSAQDRLKKARTPDEVCSALARRISPLYLDPNGLPLQIAPGAMYLQPTEERRRSGSHYTPRSLTEPIVRTTLEPVLRQLGEHPTPQQILSLKVCDPAMGSGAFLVEACRYLAEALVEAWSVHQEAPPIPPDQEPVLHARRIIAQRCLYGVDRNRFAVDLAKLSLWLATLAKDHPFTFLDHSLRWGDSLVGLNARQVEAIHWAPKDEGALLKDLPSRLEHLLKARAQILASADDTPYETLVQKLALVEQQMADLRLAGDLAIAAFFSAAKPKPREANRKELAEKYRKAVDKVVDTELDEELRLTVERLGEGPNAIHPFHWELEFPEVFVATGRSRGGGFDAIVGNPPFAGKNTLIGGNAGGYLDWLKMQHPESHGNADLVAHFFRRSFTLLRPQGCFGLIATNTIGQGDTRSTGLRWICKNGGTIYQARKRTKWPGMAAVVVSVVHVAKGALSAPFLLDGREVPIITAYLFHDGGHDDPENLVANEGKSFIGSYVLGMGFTFDDTDKSGVASPLAEMERLIQKDPRNRERIFPYIGGEEVNNSPTHAHHRYVINFEDFPLKRKERRVSTTLRHQAMQFSDFLSLTVPAC